MSWYHLGVASELGQTQDGSTVVQYMEVKGVQT